MAELRIKGGLRENLKDIRDFKLGKIVPSTILDEQLPERFVLDTLGVKNQFDTDMCTAFATTLVSEIQEGVELSPEWQFKETKKIEGDYKSWGASGRSAAKAACNGGLVQEFSPYKTEFDNRDIIANPANWSSEKDLSAKSHAKRSYFEVTKIGDADLFDSIRYSLWAYRSENRAITAGVIWSSEWNNAIVSEQGTPTFGHLIAIIGWTMILNAPYLVIQNSAGKDFADGGKQYFSRDIVNSRFGGKYGLYMFLDYPPEQVKNVQWSFWQKIIDTIKKFLK